ncbi:MAG: histidine kinase [Marinilabiliaceae bacterium]|nr:histidine kinase [Marinilabiliaceae bacterium]
MIISTLLVKSNKIGIIIHLGVWLALISIPLLIQIESEGLNFRMMSHIWVMLFGLMATFYANYLFGIDNLLYRKRTILFILFNIVVFFFLHYFNDFINDLIQGVFENRPRRRNHGPNVAVRSMFLYTDFIYYALGVGAALACRYAGRVSDIEKEREILQNEKLENEINLLKYQLQPHFFFNTLNNIYSLIGLSPNDAQKAVHSLSKMMRYVLYDNTAQRISLKSEIDFIENYCRLKKLSLNDRVHISMSFPEDTRNITLPPLLLIPLVENAFKHSTTPDKESMIELNLSLDKNDTISFIVRNTIAPKQGNEDRSHSGIGLNNLKKLLDLQYPNGRYSLKTGESQEGIFEATLTLKQ